MFIFESEIIETCEQMPMTSSQTRTFLSGSSSSVLFDKYCHKKKNQIQSCLISKEVRKMKLTEIRMKIKANLVT
jgi:hypothetical protein